MSKKPSGLLDGLIASKLRPPVMDSRAISRSAFLYSVLEQTADSRAITLVAPAGSGKSSLMTELHQVLVHRGIASSWLSLDKEDNDPATFARYFISAIQVIEPGFAYDELLALGANPARDFDAFFKRLVTHLSKLDQDFAVCLDDFQNIDDPRLINFLDELIAHMPTSMTIVIASRHQLPLKLARLSVAGRAIEIDQSLLSFDRDQAALFLRRYHNLQLTPEALQQLVDLTEGWPTGVQLAGLTLRRFSGDPSELLRGFSGRNRDLTKYLAESVIQAQSETVRRFLLRTSVLRRMNASLCAAVGAAENTEALLDEIRRANLFLIALDGEGLWFRYHHLFAEFLQNEFRRTDPQAYRETCLLACQWYENSDAPDEAIRYALEAEYFEQAADLIARHSLRTSLFHGDHYTVRDWMRRLPERYHGRHPELLLAHAWSLAFSRDTARAMHIAESVLERLRKGAWALTDTERERWLMWAGVVQAATCACADTIEECIKRSDALLPNVPKEEPFLVATLGNCLGYSHFAQLNVEKSQIFAVVAHENGHLADANYLSAWGDFIHGLIDVEKGELRAAARLGARVRRDSSSLGLGQKSYVAGLAALLEAEIAVQRVDIESATRLIDVGRAFKEIFGPVEPQLVALRNEARLLVLSGEIDSAQIVLEQGQEGALRERHHRLYLMLAMEQVSLLLHVGLPELARKVADQTRVFDEPIGESGWRRAQRRSLCLLQARLRLQQGNFKAAASALTTLQQGRGAVRLGAHSLTVATCRAIALWGLGNQSDAIRQLDRAMTAAAPEHHLYPLISAGASVLPLLESMEKRRKGVSSDALESRNEIHVAMKRALSLRETQQQADSKTDKAAEVESSILVAKLTRRELDMLRLAQAGLSNKEISDALFVSVSTVKWHLHNIYEKCGVSSRAAAIAVAVREGQMAALEPKLV